MNSHFYPLVYPARLAAQAARNHRRFSAWAAGCAAACFLLLAAGCGVQKEVFDGVQLILSGEELAPTTTFELRFDEPAARPDQVGAAAEPSPLVIAPDIHGVFTWLSQRSGVFTPDEPLALDTAYRFTLRPALRQPDGQPLHARLRHVLRTPPLRVTAMPRGTGPEASSVPEIKLFFNAPVRAAAARSYAVFRNAAGHSVPAEVWQGTTGDRPPYYMWEAPRSLGTWREEFYTARRRANLPVPEAAGEGAHARSNEVANLLVVVPSRPLPVGAGWRLEVSAGLPADEDSLRLPAKLRVEVGDVTPFIVTGVSVHNNISHPKLLKINLSKRPAAPLCESNAILDWIDVTPLPENLTAEVNWQTTVLLRGDFKLATPYRVTVRAGLPAQERFTLEEAFTEEFTVPPVAPRLYFPAYSTDQWSGGRRQFPLLVINVAKVRVRAKLLDAPTVIHALRGYRSYYKTSDDSDTYEEPNKGVDYNLVPGRTIWSNEVAAAKQTDVAEEIPLDWDRVLGERKAGVIFVAAERVALDNNDRRRLGTEALIQLTDLGLIWKSADGQTCVFVFSHTTGRPVPRATVSLYSDENEPLATTTTDDSGLARLAAPTNAVWVAAQLGDDIHALELKEHDLPLYRFDMAREFSEDRLQNRQVLLFGDRDVYRPGETLQLKAIVRDWGEHGLVIPQKLEGTLECLDARGRKFFETNVVFSALGSWSQAVPIPVGPHGPHLATLSIGDRQFPCAFRVEDFQPNAFEVKLAPKDAYAAGEPVVVPLSAKYYFGKKLNRAQVHWTIEAQDRGFNPEGFGGFQFTRWRDYRDSGAPSSVALSGEGTLTAETNFVIAPVIPLNPVAPQPRSAMLVAEVTDLNQQTLTYSAGFVRHSSDFYLGLRLGAQVLTVGQEVPVEVVSVRADGQAWPTPVKAQVSLQRVRYDSVRVQGAGRAIQYRNELIASNVVERTLDIAPLVRSTNELGEEIHGTTATGLLPTEEGEYWIEVKTQDPGGRDVVASLKFDASSPPTNPPPVVVAPPPPPEPVPWNYRNDVRIDLQPDEDSYTPGDTAVVLVQTPFAGEALVTVEREKVMRIFRTRLEGSAPSVRIPIEPGDAPNVFVSVTVVRGANDSPKEYKVPEFRAGYCKLSVDAPESHLTIAVEPAATNYLPGATVSITATVTDATDAPAPDAEVTLWAVDEGVLSLTDYQAPDPHAFFYAARRLAVDSSISLPNLLTEDPDRLEFHNKGYLIGGGGDERVRKNFLALAYWHATLRTDKNGRVIATFTAPDSLTRYRILAVAHTAKNQFGRGESAFEISKPLMLEPALPRFANITDHIQARAVVLNTTAQPGNVLVTLELDDKAQAVPAASLSRTVSITSNGAAVVEFPVVFTNIGAAKWTWRARFANDSRSANQASLPAFTDSVQTTLEVGHVAPLLTEIYLARVNATETNLLTRVNPQLLEGRGRVTVTVANTRLSELGEAVSQLLHYPYGCAEQTGSSLLPWLVLRDSPVAKFLRRSPTEIDQAIRAGLDRFSSMQTASGGLSYWPRGNEPMLWASAYGGVVLALAQRHGAPVAKDEFDRLLTYLSGSLRGLGGLDEPRQLADRCLALYALALADHAEPGYHEVMFEKREKLSAEDRALLALAILEARRSVAQAPPVTPPVTPLVPTELPLLPPLPAITAPAGPLPFTAPVPPPPAPVAVMPPAEWPKMVDELFKPAPAPSAANDEWFGCSARDTAIRLLAWVQHRPEDPIVDKLVADLMGDRRDAHWTTTQGNAWALLALTEYAARVEKKLNAAQGTITWGAQSAPFQLGENASVWEHTFTLTSDLAATPLVLANPSKGRLYTQVKIESRSQVAKQPRQDRGFNLQRSYALLDDNNQPQDLKNLRVGDRVLVTLTLGVRQAAHWLAIDDPLPATLEAVNPEFKTQQAKADAPTAPNASAPDNNWIINFRELRTDRALFFADYVPPGDYTLRYVARVRAAGEVTAPSPKAEEMYHPDRFGLSASESFASKPTE